MRDFFHRLWGYIFYLICGILLGGQWIELFKVMQGRETIAFDDDVYHRVDDPIFFYVAAIFNSITILSFSLLWIIIGIIVIIIKFGITRTPDPETENAKYFKEMLEEDKEIKAAQKNKNK